MQLTEHQKKVKELYDRAYRKKYKRCRHCEWFGHREITRYDPFLYQRCLTNITVCVLKNKAISDNSRRALLCKYYNPKP